MKYKYWKMYVQTKADCLYLGIYLKRLRRWDAVIRTALAVITSGSVTAWAIWQSYPLIWAAIVAVAQIVSIIRDHIAALKHISPLSYFLPELEKLLLEIDYQWELVNSDTLDDQKIGDLSYSFEAKLLEMQNKYIPSIKLDDLKIAKQAGDEAEQYFSQRFDLKGSEIHVK